MPADALPLASTSLEPPFPHFRWALGPWGAKTDDVTDPRRGLHSQGGGNGATYGRIKIWTRGRGWQSVQHRFTHAPCGRPPLCARVRAPGRPPAAHAPLVGGSFGSGGRDAGCGPPTWKERLSGAGRPEVTGGRGEWPAAFYFWNGGSGLDRRRSEVRKSHTVPRHGPTHPRISLLGVGPRPSPYPWSHPRQRAVGVPRGSASSSGREETRGWAASPGFFCSASGLDS